MVSVMEDDAPRQLREPGESTPKALKALNEIDQDDPGF